MLNTDVSFDYVINNFTVTPSFDLSGVILTDVINGIDFYVEGTHNSFNPVLTENGDTINTQTKISLYGFINLPPPESTDFIEFNDLTKEQCISWLKGKINCENYENEIFKQIKDIVEPKTTIKQPPFLQN